MQFYSFISSCKLVLIKVQLKGQFMEYNGYVLNYE